jgi:hypothetical protein
VEDKWGDSEKHLQESLTAIGETLRNAPNGWVMYYYPGRGQAFGGFTLLMNFTDGENVTMASDVIDIEHSYSSKYILKDGPILSFDSYNLVLHFFAEPGINIGFGVGMGLGGDFEFNVMSYSNDKIVLRGTKTDNIIEMEPIPLGMSWDNYQRDLSKVVLESLSLSYNLIVPDMEFPVYVSFASSNYNVLRFNTKIDNRLYTITKTFSYTNDGIRLYDPYEIGDYKVRELKWDGTISAFRCVGEGVTDIVMNPSTPEGFRNYSYYLGAWTMYTMDSEKKEYQFDVVISRAAEDNTYRLSGSKLIANFPLKYNTNRGSIEWVATRLADLGGGYVLWVLPGDGKGAYTTDERIGIRGLVDEYADSDRFTMIDNGYGGVEGMFLMVLNSDATELLGTYTGIVPDHYMNIRMERK